MQRTSMGQRQEERDTCISPQTSITMEKTTRSRNQRFHCRRISHWIFITVLAGTVVVYLLHVTVDDPLLHALSPKRELNTPYLVSFQSCSKNEVETSYTKPKCRWIDKQTWGEEFDETNNATSFLESWQEAESNAHNIFANKSVLVLGGSTSRDLAAYFMLMTLSPETRILVTEQWKNASREGYELFPSTGKYQMEWEGMYTEDVMEPLVQAGWSFVRVRGNVAGCSDCASGYTNMDYVAVHRERNIRYEYSWKPEIFTQADVIGFKERYCGIHYDVVHIGKGLHDAAFKPMNQLTPRKIQERFLKLANLVNECFSDNTLVILRTPYLSTANSTEEPTNIISTQVLRANIGAFGPRRAVLLDGHLMTTQSNSPTSFDGHHFGSDLSTMYMNMVALIVQKFFSSDQGGCLQTPLSGLWENCGVGVDASALSRDFQPE